MAVVVAVVIAIVTFVLHQVVDWLPSKDKLEKNNNSAVCFYDCGYVCDIFKCMCLRLGGEVKLFLGNRAVSSVVVRSIIVIH